MNKYFLVDPLNGQPFWHETAELAEETAKGFIGQTDLNGNEVVTVLIYRAEVVSIVRLGP